MISLFIIIERLKKLIINKKDKFLSWLCEDIDLFDKTICDIGCGEGWTSIYFAKKNPVKVFSIEPSEGVGGSSDVFTKLLQNIETNNLNDVILPLKIDFMKNDFQDNTFDYVFGINSLHHVIELSRDKTNFIGIGKRINTLFMEINRIVKPGGKVIIWDIAFESIFRHIPIRFRQIDWYLHPKLEDWLKGANDNFKKCHINYTHLTNYSFTRYILNNRISLYLINPTFKLKLTK